MIDENEFSRKIIKSYLNEWGCIASDAKNAEEVFEVLCNVYDVIIFDSVMSTMNGLELAEQIKKDDKLKNIPLICLTSIPKRGDVKLNSKFLFSGYLIKPLRKDELRDCIAMVLSIYDPEKEMETRPIVTRHLILENREKQKFSILVAEDNKINQKLIVKMLLYYGYKADVVNDGLEALNALKQQKYDLVLMDCQMPDMNGYEATEKIRQMEEFKFLPIIALTAHTMTGDREKCIAAGMNDFISKPIDPEKLIKLLESWLNKKNIIPAKTGIQFS